MKLPNGYGSIYKLSGKRRKPWAVQKTVGWTIDPETKKNKQQRITIGYCATKGEALQLLADYNSNPYDLSNASKTFSEIYELWSEKKYQKVQDKTVACYVAAYKHCESIYDRPLNSLKTAELQQVIDACPAGSNTKTNIKVIMNGVFEYALQNDIVNKNYSSFIEIEASDPIIERLEFTRNEIDELWKRTDNFAARIVLILLYNGMRVNELLKMTRDCCNLEERSLNITQAKNKYSIRKVPIHDKVFDLVKDFYNMNNENLIVNDSGFKVTYNNFATRDFIKLMKELGCPDHHLHDTRHTFITTSRKYMDKLLLQKIVGHKPSDITDQVYTHIHFDELLKAINKIKEI